MQNKIHFRMLPSRHLQELINRGLPYIVQPIIKNGNKIKTPINHDGGSVLCLTDVTQVTQAQNGLYKCLACKTDITLDKLYLDVSMEVILNEIQDNQSLQHTKCIKILQNGSWEVLAEDYEYFIQDQQQSPLVVSMNEQFEQLQNRLSGFIRNPASSIYQDLNLISSVNDIAQKIDISQLQYGGLDIFITRRTDFDYLNGFEIYYTKNKIRELVTIAILGKDMKRDQVRLAQFHQESRIFYTKTAVYIIGGEHKDGKKELGFNKVYVAYIKDFINDSRLWPESKLMSFTEIASLDHKRFCFQIAEYNGFLFVIGGYKKNDVEGHRIPVQKIEKLNLSIPESKWQIETFMPPQDNNIGGLYQFASCIRGHMLVLSGGAHLILVQGQVCQINLLPNKLTLLYNLQTQLWENSQQNIIQDPNQVNYYPFLIPSLKDNHTVHAFGGFAKSDVSIQSQQQKEVYQYSIATQNRQTLQQATVIIDNGIKNYDLYSQDYLQTIVQLMRRINNNVQIDAILVINDKIHGTQKIDKFGARIIIFRDGNIHQINIM